MLATVVAIIGSFLAEIAGGVIAYQLTEGRQTSPAYAPRQYMVPSQRVVVEHRHVIEYRTRSTSSEDEVWGIVVVILVIVAMVVCVVGVLATVTAQYGQSIARIIEFVSVGGAGLALTLALITIWRIDWRATWENLQVPAFILAMFVAFFFMAWMLEQPLGPPEGWLDVREALRTIEIGPEGWTSESFQIALDNFEVALFFALQALGVVVLILAMIPTFVIEGVYAYNLLAGEPIDFRPSCLIVGGIPALAALASFLLGLGWPLVATLFS